MRTKITDHPYLFLALLAVLFILPAVLIGLPQTADSRFHIIWSQEFSYEFWRGHFYPRWLSRMNSGCGDPAFFYYYPLPYYLSSLFSFTGNWGTEGWYPLVLAITVALILMGIACHRWLSSLMRNKTACLCGAALYMFSPSSITFIYMPVAYSHLTGLIFLPLLLLAAQKIVQGAHGAIAFFALMLAGLDTASITYAVSAAWLPVLYCLFYGWREKKLAATLPKLGLAVLLGTALAAIYLVPLWELRPYSQGTGTSDLTSGPYYFANNFLFGWSSWTGVMKTTLVIQSMEHLYIVLMIFWLAYRIRHFYPASFRNTILFWSVAGMGIFLMETPLSRLIWNHVPMLHVLQFPGRFGDNLFPIMLALFTAWYLAGKSGTRIFSSFIAIMMLLILLCPWAITLSKHYVIPDDLKANPLAQFRRVPFDQFFPTSVQPEWLGLAPAETLDALCKRKIHLEKGAAEVTITEWHSRHIRFRVKAETESSITVSQFSFPGWAARDAAHPEITYPITLSPEGAGLMTVTVPPGEHLVRLELETLPPEHYGAIISAAALCILLGMLAYSRKRGERQEHDLTA